jgi:predicted glycosyltransferase involved in capsule biosynthesis
MQKISIVTAYHNRRRQFIQTLKSISKTQHDNYQVIAVDDHSKKEEEIIDLVDQFSFLKVVELKGPKWYTNPCVPFNIGINQTFYNDTDIVILQNPECVHVHDILMHTEQNLSDNLYLTFAAYNINKSNTEKLYKSKDINIFFNSLPQRRNGGIKVGGWLNHSKYRPSYYHFCSAITKNNMMLLNGFDTKYAYGVGYDDNDLINRIKKLNLKIEIVDNFSVIHQYHDPIYANNNEINKKLKEINKVLFYETWKKSK